MNGTVWIIGLSVNDVSYTQPVVDLVSYTVIFEMFRKILRRRLIQGLTAMRASFVEATAERPCGSFWREDLCCHIAAVELVRVMRRSGQSLVTM